MPIYRNKQEKQIILIFPSFHHKTMVGSNSDKNKKEYNICNRCLFTEIDKTNKLGNYSCSFFFPSLTSDAGVKKQLGQE